MKNFLAQIFTPADRETPLQRYFRIEYSNEYKQLKDAGMKPHDKLISEITKKH